ncbi:esterase/lipase family protein [Actinomadura rupiterrae]|uniref:esterase/lipase family protein n=1 Tax=Actinomadura rupiterrae TaxID=559627 RepID=UPI0020A31031|nr:alpha/beta fold hydrolase [Actinomadura rupiterrae]MCP2342584.1 pimeloyl-ACP methyl ester carboxylesterase [Actinomadura rupiterrae]
MGFTLRSVLLAAGAAAATAVLTAAAPSGTAAADTGRYPVLSLTQMGANEARFILTGQDPGQSAPGVNVPGCVPSPAHPEPVVLLHGLDGNQYNGWAMIGPTLANAGYCVYSLNYGGTGAFDGGTRHVAESATQIAAFIDKVRSETGAAKVRLVGHSEGGFMALYVPKKVPGMAAKVSRVVALAPPSHGTDLFGAVTILDVLHLRPVVGTACAGCADILAGSDVMKDFTATPIAQPGIDYTTLISKHDEAITPYTSAALHEPGTHDLVVQDTCPDDPVGHTGLAYDKGVVTMVTNALDPAHAQPVTCDSGIPF